MAENTLRPAVMQLKFPFIAKKTGFDARTLIEGRDSEKIHAYALALAIEIAANAEEFEDCRIDAIRLDGGSASIVDGQDIEKLLRLIRSRYRVAEDAPVSLETCPADINGANMPYLNRAHIARYDLELYSLESQDFPYLDTLNYIDQMPYISSGFLRAAQRDNMGFVLLCGKQHVSRWGFRRSVIACTRHPVCHVIMKRCAGEDAMSDAETAAQLVMADQILSDAGFVRYAETLWARPGKEDPVLKAEREGGEIIAFGLGARTIFDGAVSVNTSDYERYVTGSGDYRKITLNAHPLV